ncbi:hypothetical protein ACQJBY_054474 [Aegilops geniculata]
MSTGATALSRSTNGGGERRCSFSSSTSKDVHRYNSGTPVPKSPPPIRRCPAHPHGRGFASSCTRHLKRGCGTLLPSNLFGLCKGKRMDESNVWLGCVKGSEEGNDMEQLQGHTGRGGQPRRHGR